MKHLIFIAALLAAVTWGDSFAQGSSLRFTVESHRTEIQMLGEKAKGVDDQLYLLHATIPLTESDFNAKTPGVDFISTKGRYAVYVRVGRLFNARSVVEDLAMSYMFIHKENPDIVISFQWDDKSEIIPNYIAIPNDSGVIQSESVIPELHYLDGRPLSYWDSLPPEPSEDILGVRIYKRTGNVLTEIPVDSVEENVNIARMEFTGPDGTKVPNLQVRSSDIRLEYAPDYQHTGITIEPSPGYREHWYYWNGKWWQEDLPWNVTPRAALMWFDDGETQRAWVNNFNLPEERLEKVFKLFRNKEFVWANGHACRFDASGRVVDYGMDIEAIKDRMLWAIKQSRK